MHGNVDGRILSIIAQGLKELSVKTFESKAFIKIDPPKKSHPVRAVALVHFKK
jgi:hypothetical protein